MAAECTEQKTIHYARKGFVIKLLAGFWALYPVFPLAGFIAATLAVALFPALPSKAALGWGALVAVVLACALACWRRACGGNVRCLASCLAGALAGLLLATWHGHALLERRLPEACVRQQVEIEGVVVSLPVRRRFDADTVRQRFEFRATRIVPGQCAAPRKLLLSYTTERPIVPGERWRLRARLKRPWGLANPGSHNMQAWFAQTGIDAVGSVAQGERLALAAPLTAPHHRLRGYLAERIDGQGFRDAVAAVLKALTVAERSGVDGELWRLFQAYGVSHLLVISGLHIGLVAGLGYALGGLLSRLTGGAVPNLPVILALALGFFYAALAGFTLPTQRALAMLVAPSLASLVDRSGATSYVLLLAAACVLLLNPLAPLGGGFWLSFGAVAMLLWIGAWYSEEALSRRLLRVHSAMALLMVPVGGWFFGGASLVAAPANFLLIPLLGFVVVPAALLAVAAELAGSSAAAQAWSLAAWPVDKMLLLGATLAQAEGDTLYREVTARWYELGLALGGLLLLLVPVGWRTRFAALVLVLPLLAPHEGREQQADDELLVTVLDVGQGTAVVVKSGRRVMLYDTGGGDPAGHNLARSVVLPYLRHLGVSDLDTLIVSHSDLDHSAGTQAILDSFPVQRYRYGGETPAGRGGRTCRAGEAWRWSTLVSFQFLSPAPGETLASNDQSCVLLVSTPGYELLFLGDVEQGRERELARYWSGRLHSDLLLVGHHGSRTSSTWPLLKQSQPGLAVISAGYANRFGHPHPLVIGRLEQMGAVVLNTAYTGALEIRIGPHGLGSVDSYRENYHRYWM